MQHQLCGDWLLMHSCLTCCTNQFLSCGMWRVSVTADDSGTFYFKNLILWCWQLSPKNIAWQHCGNFQTQHRAKHTLCFYFFSLILLFVFFCSVPSFIYGILRLLHSALLFSSADASFPGVFFVTMTRQFAIFTPSKWNESSLWFWSFSLVSVKPEVSVATKVVKHRGREQNKERDRWNKAVCVCVCVWLMYGISGATGVESRDSPLRKLEQALKPSRLPLPVILSLSPT